MKEWREIVDLKRGAIDWRVFNLFTPIPVQIGVRVQIGLPVQIGVRVQIGLPVQIGVRVRLGSPVRIGLILGQSVTPSHPLPPAKPRSHCTSLILEHILQATYLSV